MAAIAKRRSLGLARLKGDDVERSIIEQMLEAANWAPSHGDTEPWRFQVFTGESRRELAEAYAAAYRAGCEGSPDPVKKKANYDRAFASPVWISIGMRPLISPEGKQIHSEEEEVLAVGCAVQNLHLMACAHGLVGMWHSKGVSVCEYMRDWLGLQAPGRLMGFFFCGYPKVEWPEGERRPLSEKVVWR